MQRTCIFILAKPMSRQCSKASVGCLVGSSIRKVALCGALHCAAASLSLITWVAFVPQRPRAVHKWRLCKSCRFAYGQQTPVKIPQIWLRLGEAFRAATDPTIIRYKGLYISSRRICIRLT